MPPKNLKVLTDLATTPLLRLHFAVLVILKFGLHLLDAKSLEEISHKPLTMDVYIQHEPADIKDFLRLFDISGWRDAPPMMGIPQIKKKNRLSMFHQKIPTFSQIKPA